MKALKWTSSCEKRYREAIDILDIPGSFCRCVQADIEMYEAVHPGDRTEFKAVAFNRPVLEKLQQNKWLTTKLDKKKRYYKPSDLES